MNVWFACQEATYVVNSCEKKEQQYCNMNHSYGEFDFAATNAREMNLANISRRNGSGVGRKFLDEYVISLTTDVIPLIG